MRSLRLVHSAERLEEPRAGPIAPLNPDVRAMLEHVRVVAPLPRALRARVLARARGLLRSAGALRALPPL